MAAPTIVTIRPGVAFTPEAAASWRRMETQVGRPIDCNSSYRDWDQQYRMWQAWEAWVTGKGPKPPHGRAIHPDRSMHCKGLAADTDDVALLLSLADHGWRRTANDEPWHFEYWQTFDRHYGQPAGGDPKPFPDPAAPEEEEDDMAKTTGVYWTRKADGVTVFALTNPVSGYWSEWSGVDGSYNNRMAAGFDTGSFVSVTESHAANLKASAAAIRG